MTYRFGNIPVTIYKTNAENAGDCNDRTVNVLAVMGFAVVCLLFASTVRGSCGTLEARNYTIAENEDALSVSAISESGDGGSLKEHIEERLCDISPADVIEETFTGIFTFGGDK